jgi:uncharacterized protein YceH (UPF0502 family)
MHLRELTGPEQRVLGCLIEKRFTTPDQYPLTLNALRLACNQSTNRDPVVSYDEDTVREAAQRLTRYGVARLASGHSSRATKYRHLAEDALALGAGQLAVLCVLLLRGAQTVGEVKLRTERMVSFDSLEEVDRVLGELSERGFARRVPRRPGQKEDRFEQLLGVEGDAGGGEGTGGEAAGHREPVGAADSAAREGVRAPAAPSDTLAAANSGPPVAAHEGEADELRERLDALEEELAVLRAEVAALRAELG